LSGASAREEARQNLDLLPVRKRLLQHGAAIGILNHVATEVVFDQRRQFLLMMTMRAKPVWIRPAFELIWLKLAARSPTPTCG
jgi:hypothetical protein